MKKKNEKGKSKNVAKKGEAKEVKEMREVKETKKTKETEEKEDIVSYKTMTDNEMLDLFVSLKDTSYWQAILKSNRDRDSIIISSLAFLDPFKEPTKTARAQGERIGLYYIETEVNKLIEAKKRMEEGNE